MRLSYFLYLFFICRSLGCLAVSSISSLEPLFPNQTLISPSQIFELGFFTPNGSVSQYVGMWYKNFTPSRVVWVANRHQPLDYKDQLASLTVGGDGNLRLFDGARNVVWSTNVSRGSNSSVAMLLDTGNLVVEDSGNTVWESFRFPTDILLPGMKIEINVKTGEKTYLISWKNSTDPSPGNFTVGVTSEIPSQPFTWNGLAPYWRGGQWDKSKFIGIANASSGYLSLHNVQQDIQQGTTTYSLTTFNDTFFAYIFISSEGSLELVFWNESDRNWILNWEAPQDLCETYGTCGPFSVCNSSVSPICKCLDGFTPKSEEEWKSGNWTGGCSRKKELKCQRDLNIGAPAGSAANQADYFLKLSQMKLPDAANYISPLDDNPEGCWDWCFNNCSCIAYSYVDNIGCLTWFGEVMDIQSFKTSGKDLFLRLAYDEVSDNTDQRRKIIAISLATIFSSIILGAGIYYAMWKRRANEQESASSHVRAFLKDGLIEETFLCCLPSMAWQLWREGRGVEFIDESISADCAAWLPEITRCIQVGLLCTQDQPMLRPNMPSVSSMLSGELDLPDPKPPTMTCFHSPSNDEIHPQQGTTLSTNTVTLTGIEAR
ncbi:hypothetical protein SAY87_010051 [Trapa incisa]|uniref:Uncharacterized protein n=1 Tax=Trapa incisa TaxID=236973 RepID=A0AAN7JHA9_9MYRT|nr:hypothetical protein SAY87_010051 [Trapa incisa]